ADTGQLINSLLIAGVMITQPAIGADANGRIVIVQPAGAGGFWAATEPGYIVAYGLGAAAQVQTTTTVQTTTQTTQTNQITTQLTTVVTSTAAGGGVAPEALYGAIGLAVIFIIATGVLALRRRKPAS